MTARYSIDKAADGWLVIDTTTGDVALVNGIPQRGLTFEDADDLADALSLLDRPRDAPIN